jgi:hypothetical protein
MWLLSPSPRRKVLAVESKQMIRHAETASRSLENLAAVYWIRGGLHDLDGLAISEISK